MSIDKAKHQLSREIWCLRRERTVTDYGQGFLAGMVRAWRELTSDWKITEGEIAAHWACKEWQEGDVPYSQRPLWQPWVDFDDYKPGAPLPITEPPCMSCGYFNPVRGTNNVMDTKAKICHSKDMHSDFSCWRSE